MPIEISCVAFIIITKSVVHLQVILYPPLPFVEWEEGSSTPLFLHLSIWLLQYAPVTTETEPDTASNWSMIKIAQQRHDPWSRWQPTTENEHYKLCITGEHLHLKRPRFSLQTRHTTRRLLMGVRKGQGEYHDGETAQTWRENISWGAVWQCVCETDDRLCE